MSIINIAFLQAKLALVLRYDDFASSMAKLLLGVLFIYLGFSVTGAVGALVIAGIVAYLLDFTA